MMAAVCRRPGMTHAEYVAYLQHVHGALSTANPVTLRRYVQNHVFDAAFGATTERSHTMVAARDSVTELYWDNSEDLGTTFAHEHVRSKVGPDARNFADEGATLSVVAEEVEQPVAQPAPRSGAKVMHYLRAAEGLALPEFFERWERAHKRALGIEPVAAATQRRCVHSRQLPEFNETLVYFGGNDMPIYEGVASVWYDNPATVGAFRAYERALLEINTCPESTFYRPESSFFLYATEVSIFERPELGADQEGVSVANQ